MRQASVPSYLTLDGLGSCSFPVCKEQWPSQACLYTFEIQLGKQSAVRKALGKAHKVLNLPLNCPSPSTAGLLIPKHLSPYDYGKSAWERWWPEVPHTAQKPFALLLTERGASKSNTSSGGTSLLRFPGGPEQLPTANVSLEQPKTSERKKQLLRVTAQTGQIRPDSGLKHPESLQAVTRDAVIEVENSLEEVILIYVKGSHLRNQITLGEGTDLSLLEAFGNLVLCTVESSSLCNSNSSPRQNQDI